MREILINILLYCLASVYVFLFIGVCKFFELPFEFGALCFILLEHFKKDLDELRDK